MRLARRPDLDGVREQFEAWRAGGHLRRAFPERLWRAAVELLDRYPPSTICQRLRLHPTRFKRARRAFGASRTKDVAVGRAFVEWPPLALAAAPEHAATCNAAALGGVGACRIVLENASGARLSVEFAQIDQACLETMCRLVLDDKSDDETAVRSTLGVVGAIRS